MVRRAYNHPLQWTHLAFAHTLTLNALASVLMPAPGNETLKKETSYESPRRLPHHLRPHLAACASNRDWRQIRRWSRSCFPPRAGISPRRERTRSRRRLRREDLEG